MGSHSGANQFCYLHTISFINPRNDFRNGQAPSFLFQDGMKFLGPKSLCDTGGPIQNSTTLKRIIGQTCDLIHL